MLSDTHRVCNNGHYACIVAHLAYTYRIVLGCITVIV